MDSVPTIVVSIIGTANIVAVGGLIFKAGGLVSRLGSLIIDVQQLTTQVNDLKLKVVKLDVIIERRSSSRRYEDQASQHEDN